MAVAGVADFVEAGSGKVLAGLVKRIVAGAAPVSIGTAEDIAAWKARKA
jgi:[acyl-carrier-protein] S-malonyltransferase